MPELSKPTFIIQIEGKTLTQDITQEISSFTFEDNEREMDVLTLTLSNRNNQFTDHPLFTVGNEIAARWGYVGQLSPRKQVVIKDLDYLFPESSEPTIRIKAFDKGYRLSGKEAQRVWKKPPPGIRYSEIAEEIARAHGLNPVIEPTNTFHLRVAQSNQSDAVFLQALAHKARGQLGDGRAGFVFYVQDNNLHFHSRRLEEEPQVVLEYHTDREGLLQSIRLETSGQGAKGAGTEVRAIGLDPRKKETVSHLANNQTAPERTTLGKGTYLVDANSGEVKFREQESGHVVPSFERTESFHQEPEHEPGQDVAESRFKHAELQQVQATAKIIGLPTLRAKQNIEVRGIGKKFSGIYYVQTVRHTIGGNGYSCDLTLRKNAVGKSHADTASESLGKPNNEHGATPNQPAAPEMVTVDAETGVVITDPRRP